MRDFLRRLFYGRAIAKSILELCEGPGITMLYFKDGHDISITNNNFSGDGFKELLENAKLAGETYREQLNTIRVLAEKLV